MQRYGLFLVIVLIGLQIVWAKDPKDPAMYKKHKNFYGKEKDYLITDFDRFQHVREIQAYDPVFHFPPIRQDTTGTCWCFCTTSFLESELHRLGRGDIELSRMFTVYWEYVEKVRRFVREKGSSLVAEGSQPNAVIERMKQYGAVRASDYSGLLPGNTIHNHAPMLEDILDYLDYIKANALWQEEQVIANVRMILDRYLGRPPETITVQGEEMTPVEFLQNRLQLPLDEYVSIMSFKKIPFWTQDKYDVPDNWWLDDEYYNVPLPEFYEAIRSAIRQDFTLVIAGDVSEPGKYGWKDIGVVPSFDIPSDYINQDSREFRFYNNTSTDDHGMHLVGYKRFQGEDWFLIKDSASSAWRGEFDGYHFFHKDFIKLKTLAILTHRDAVAELLETFEAQKQKQ